MCQSDEEFITEKREQGVTDAEIAVMFRNFGYENPEIQALGLPATDAEADASLADDENIPEDEPTAATSLGATAGYPVNVESPV
jgi:hypothetical protein